MVQKITYILNGMILQVGWSLGGYHPIPMTDPWDERYILLCLKM